MLRSKQLTAVEWRHEQQKRRSSVASSSTSTSTTSSAASMSKRRSTSSSSASREPSARRAKKVGGYVRALVDDDAPRKKHLKAGRRLGKGMAGSARYARRVAEAGGVEALVLRLERTAAAAPPVDAELASGWGRSPWDFNFESKFSVDWGTKGLKQFVQKMTDFLGKDGALAGAKAAGRALRWFAPALAATAHARRSPSLTLRHR